MADKSIRIIIGGDTVPTESNSVAFEEGNAKHLIGDALLDLLVSADLSIVNLETPLVDTENPIPKCGPNLIASSAVAAGLAEMGIDVCSLSNNHIMDQGANGLNSTIAALNAHGIGHFGAGEDLRAAREPYIFEEHGIRIGIYACAEHEFSIAGEGAAGANPFDPLYSPDQIVALKEQCDFVVVLYHGGKEHYRYPSPLLRKVCRRLVEKGADLVVCQHSHCVGCMEEWEGSTIVYGQGNFLFDHSESEFWQTGLLLEVDVARGYHEVHYLPLRKHGASVRLADPSDASEILGGFEGRSQEIAEKGFVEAEYRCFALENIANYIGAFIPGTRSLPFRVLNKLSGRRLLKVASGGVERLTALNFIECEAHRELFIEGLRSLGGQNDSER